MRSVKEKYFLKTFYFNVFSKKIEKQVCSFIKNEDEFFIKKIN
jgi:hypothetical protein